MTTKDDNDRRKRPVRPQIAQQIDENLKLLYADYANEHLPDSLTKLLASLQTKDA